MFAHRITRRLHRRGYRDDNRRDNIRGYTVRCHPGYGPRSRHYDDCPAVNDDRAGHHHHRYHDIVDIFTDYGDNSGCHCPGNDLYRWK